MRKVLLYFWFTSCCMISAEAQNIKASVQKSALFEDNYKSSNIVLAEHEQDEIILVRSYKSSGSVVKGYYIERYDADMKLIKDHTFEIKSSNLQKYPVTVGCFKMGSNVVLVEMLYDLNEKAYVCYANAINIQDFKTERKELFRLNRGELKKEGNFSLEKMFFDQMNSSMKANSDGTFLGKSDGEEEPFFFADMSILSNKKTQFHPTSTSGVALTVNKDKNAFAIAVDFSADDKEKVKFYLFDAALAKTQEYDFNRAVTDKDYIFQNIALSDSGKEIYAAAKAFDKKLKEKVKYRYEITKINASGEQSQFIGTGDHFVGSIKMIAENNKLVCLGFHSDKSDIRYKGVAYFELDAEKMTLEKTNYEVFSDQFFVDKYGESEKREVKFLMPKEILKAANGDYIFNSEECYSTYTGGNSGFAGVNGGFSGGNNGFTGGSNFNFYGYDDIVSVRINQDGKLLWSRNINKAQTIGDWENEDYLSYSTLLDNDNVYFFINSANKINKLSADRIEFTGTARKTNSDVTIIQITPQGDFDYNELLDRAENEVPFMVAKGLRNKNAIYFLGRRGKEKQLLKITL